MPKDTFYNIDDEKRRRIIVAAIKEFSQHSIRHASLNRILRNASIPKGSFYQYFEDVDDLYRLVINQIYNNELEKINEFSTESSNFLELGERAIRFYYPKIMDDGHVFHHAFINSNAIFFQDIFLEGINDRYPNILMKFGEFDDVFLELVASTIMHTLSASLMRRLTLDESIQLYELMYSYIKEGDL
jgi:AcrR family transcriptional regulator